MITALVFQKDQLLGEFAFSFVLCPRSDRGRMEWPLLPVFAVCLSFGAGAAGRCHYPPTAWCSSAEAALQCGVLKHCVEANVTRRRGAEPVKVGVFYETLCPDCRDFITNMLYPSSVLLRDIMDLTVVPYGNAQETFDGQKYVFTCQHGEPECLCNMIQACLLKLTPDAALNIIFCMEAAADVLEAAEPCIKLLAPRLSLDELWGCVNGDLGNKLMHQNAVQTDALSPPHTSVPWITVDGVHTDDLQEKALSALIPLVCSSYKGTKPAVCG